MGTRAPGDQVNIAFHEHRGGSVQRGSAPKGRLGGAFNAWNALFLATRVGIGRTVVRLAFRQRWRLSKSASRGFRSGRVTFEGVPLMSN
jgi:hypothetical protein